MSEDISIPKWFWIVAALAFVWNLLGLAAFVSQMTMTAEAMSQLSQAEQDLYASTPIWVEFAFGCAVIGGTFGCLGLLLRKALALPILIVSLVGVIVQMSYNFLISKVMEVYGPGSAIMPSMVIVIAFALIWLAKESRSKKWLS